MVRATKQHAPALPPPESVGVNSGKDSGTTPYQQNVDGCPCKKRRP